jgi:DNA-binding response OmpR family regulator
MEPGRKILVIDDNPDLMTLVRMTLESEGFSVIRAARL